MLAEPVISQSPGLEEAYKAVELDLRNKELERKEFEPLEVYLNLKEFKSFYDKLGPPTTIWRGMLSIEEKIDKLIDSWSMTSSKCNRAGFEQIQSLIIHYKGFQTTIVPYLKHNKKRLAKFCEPLFDTSELAIPQVNLH